jgi:hypothetical protein
MKRSLRKAVRRVSKRLTRLTDNYIVLTGKPARGCIQVADEGADAVCDLLKLSRALRDVCPEDYDDPVCSPEYAAAWAAISAAEV